MISITKAPNTTIKSSNRIVSIDALRGFTMLFIIGGGGLMSSFYKVWPNSLTEVLDKNMHHAGWEGFYFMDLIFPLFLFLVGVLLPFVILSKVENGTKPRELYPHIFKRTSVLILLGLVNYGYLISKQCDGQACSVGLAYVTF